MASARALDWANFMLSSWLKQFKFKFGSEMLHHLRASGFGLASAQTGSFSKIEVCPASLWQVNYLIGYAILLGQANVIRLVRPGLKSASVHSSSQVY